MGLTGRDMKQAYEIYQGNFFEGGWIDNRALSAAVAAWAGKQPWAENLAGTAGPLVEMYVKNELDRPELMADFVNQLPDPLRAEALAALAEDVASMLEDGEDDDDDGDDDDGEDSVDAAPLLARIKALISPGTVGAKPTEGQLKAAYRKADELTDDEKWREAIDLLTPVLDTLEPEMGGTDSRRVAAASCFVQRALSLSNVAAFAAAKADYLTAKKWQEAGLLSPERMMIMLAEMQCYEEKDYAGAIATAQATLAGTLKSPSYCRFYFLKVLGYAALGLRASDDAQKHFAALYAAFKDDKSKMADLYSDVDDERAAQAREIFAALAG
jgi:hypothetical protein